MKISKTAFRILLWVIVSTGCVMSAGVVRADSHDNSYYVNVHKFLVYDKPTVNSKAYDDGLKIGHELRKATAAGKVPSGWIYVRFYIPGGSDLYDGWVREQDVVAYRTFVTVSKAWPVHYYCYWRIDGPKINEKEDALGATYQKLSTGTVVFEAAFERNGSAQIHILDTTPHITGLFTPGTVEPKKQKQTFSGQIYHSGNVYMLKYGREHKIAFTYGFDRSKNTFFGGESSYVDGQGAPSRLGGKKAYWTRYLFGQKINLGKGVAKYCTHVPSGRR